MKTLISIDDIDDSDLEKFGIFGKSYILASSKPSIVELCRYCISNEKYSNKLFQLFEKNSTILEFKQFKQKYYDTSKANILKNFLHKIHTENSINSDQIIYHSRRRKWLTMVENTELRDYQTECAEIIKSNFYSK